MVSNHKYSIATKLNEMYTQGERSKEKTDTTVRVDNVEDDEAKNLLKRD